MCLIFSPKWVKFRYAIVDVILQLIFDGFCLQKSMKNGSKINPKSTKNGNSGLEASWRRLGDILGRLGASWKHFGVSWEV